MTYRDITSQSAQTLWGTRAAERNAETRKRLERGIMSESGTR